MQTLANPIKTTNPTAAKTFSRCGMAADCSARVAQFMVNGAPPLLKDIGLNEEDAARLSVALSAMLSRVMVTNVVPHQSAKDLDLSIKVSV